MRLQKKISRTEGQPLRRAALPKPSLDSAATTTRLRSLQRTIGNVGTSRFFSRSNGGGRPLDRTTRSFFESRFQQDFSRVRVHHDAGAAVSALAIDARAYTVGNDIVFGAGQYAPATSEGRRLLAHELTHVAQQGKTSTPTVQRQPAPPPQQLTRPEEVRLSFTSPGRVEMLPNPPSLSLYNFAIWNADLKETHAAAVDLLGSVIKQFAPGTVTVTVKGHADGTGEDPINNPLSRDRSVAVQKALSAAAGVRVAISSCGKHCPVASNDTVEGRSRNRRVEISLSTRQGGGDIDWPSLCKLAPGVCLCLINPLFCHREEDDDGDGDGIDWPSLCPGTLGKIICGTVLCLFAFRLCLSAFCKRFPELCLSTICRVFPSLCKGKRKPTKDEPKRKRACPTRVDLPSGDIQAHKEEKVGYARLWYHFPMDIDFENDSTGCDCSCGEYYQLVRGFYEYDDTGKGPWQRDKHPLTIGVFLDEHQFQEDAHIASTGYGHRFWDDDTRTDPKPNARGDKFLFTRAKGCRYRGEDEPGFEYRQDYPARIRMHLEFVAGPVDACQIPGQRVNLTSHWHSWVIDGEAQAKPPNTSRKLRNLPFIVRSGLPKDPKEGQRYWLDLAIDGAPADCHGWVPVRILVVDPATIVAMTGNTDDLQLAPNACPNVWVRPYETVTIFR